MTERSTRRLRALIVEDVEQDAQLLLRELKRGGFVEVISERVDTAEAMAEALRTRTWDVVISDYSMPRFGAPLALKLVQERKLDLPFIIVSGTVGEDTAIEAIHAGAHDFMVKGRLARLIPAIERELRDVKLRAQARQMEEQLLIADRMASVGVLAAGVAHEINNPLAALMANLNYAAEELARFAQDARDSQAAPEREGGAEWIAARLGEVREPLRDAREAADRVRAIVRDLKVFSRNDEGETGAADVRRVMESSLRMAWNEIRHRATVLKVYGEVPPVAANEGRLGQVFLNLLVNAAQAIPEGRADQNEIRVSTSLDDEGRVVVEVADTGSGIAPELKGRIFDAFFTTKPVGVGTGLGLAICHRIISEAGGQLGVESALGKGTTFRISLPAAKDAVVGFRSTPVPVAARPPKRRGKILVVDDEPLLGIALRRMLGVDHEVLVASSAREALLRVGRQERYDVILSDLMMPEVTGMQLYEELRQLDVEQAERMVFMTGGAFTPVARAFLDRVNNPRIDKPFDAPSVRALMRGLIR